MKLSFFKSTQESERLNTSQMQDQPKHLYSNITMLKKYLRAELWKNGCDFQSAIGTHSADQVN